MYLLIMHSKNVNKVQTVKIKSRPVQPLKRYVSTVVEKLVSIILRYPNFSHPCN